MTTFHFAALLYLLLNSACFADECDDWFKSLKIDPKDAECEMKCAVADVDMGTFNCPLGCKRRCRAEKADSVRSAEVNEKKSDQCSQGSKDRPDCCNISEYVRKEIGTDNQCDLFARTIDNVVGSSSGQKHRTGWVVDQLKQVFIGENIFGTNRGACFIGGFVNATGFKQEFRDQGNQIRHTMAGVWSSYRLGSVGCFGMNIREWIGRDDRQDIKLNDVTCRLGKILNDKNLWQFSNLIRSTIGDESCR